MLGKPFFCKATPKFGLALNTHQKEQILKSRIQTVAEGSLYITLFTLLSKGLGFFREVITANLFGTSWKMDALIISLAPARIITSILAAGFVAIFIPEYMKIRNSSKESSYRYAWAFLCVSGFLYTFLGLMLFLFSEFFVRLFAPGFSSEILKLAADSLKMLSVLPLLSGTEQFLSGLLRAERRFLQYSVAQSIFNLVAIPIILTLAPFFGETSIIYSWIFGNLIVAVALLVPARTSLLPTKTIFTQDLKRTLLFSAPIIISSGLGHISTIVDKAFLSLLPPGRIAGMHYANTLLGIISGVLVISFLEASRTEMSEFVSLDDRTGIQL